MKSSTMAIGLWPDAMPVGIRLMTRNGNDWSSRFPLIIQAVNQLKVRSCLIDGEAVCCDERGVFELSTCCAIAATRPGGIPRCL